MDMWRSLRISGWWRSNSFKLIIVTLVLSYKLMESGCDDLSDVLEPHVITGHISFVLPDGVCNETMARTIYLELLSKYQTSDLSSVPLNDMVLMDLKRLDNLVCDFKSPTNGMLCVNGKCECALPNRVPVAFSRSVLQSLAANDSTITAGGICRLRHGELCQDSNQCFLEGICSDEEGPERLIRPGDYEWKFNAADKRACHRRWCGKEDPRCETMPRFCHDVSACRLNPFATAPFKCIQEGHVCGRHTSYAAVEKCQQECREELRGYLTTNIQRQCSRECRNKADASPCFQQCLKDYGDRLLPMERLACPSIIRFEGCIDCVAKVLGSTSERNLFSGIKRGCAGPGFCGGNPQVCPVICTGYCIQNYAVELEVGCFFECSKPGGLPPGPLCQIDCFNLRIEDVIARKAACQTDCEAPPASTRCTRCVDNCRQSTELQLQLGTFDVPHMQRCNRNFCKPLYNIDCIQCRDTYVTRITECVSTCRSNASITDIGACATNCEDQCAVNYKGWSQAVCYGNCSGLSSRGLLRIRCLENCTDENKVIFAKEDCSSVFCNKTNFKNVDHCTQQCEANCARMLGEQQLIYCSPARNICKEPELCAGCRAISVNRCKQRCRAGLDTSSQLKCQSKCLDVCESSIGPLSASGIRRPPPHTLPQIRQTCEIWCTFTSNTLCSVPCDRYCDEMFEYFCDCSNPDPNIIAQVNPPDFLTHPCVDCERDFKRRLARQCETSTCRASLAADPGGLICMNACLNQCLNTIYYRFQHYCSDINQYPDLITQQGCMEKEFEHHKALTSCFSSCVDNVPNEVPGDQQSSVCRKEGCAEVCTERGLVEARLVCKLAANSLECLPQLPSVTFPTVVPVDPNLDLSIRIRLLYLTDCRDRCRLPVDLQQANLNPDNTDIRDSTCLQICQSNCMATAFVAALPTCKNMCSTATAARCILNCIKRRWVPDEHDRCNSACDVTYPSNVKLIECPDCVRQCLDGSRHNFYEAYLIGNQTPDACVLCRANLVNTKCRRDCTNRQLTCRELCIRSCLKLICAEEVRNNFHTKTDEVYIDDCYINKEVARLDQVNQCGLDCDGGGGCRAMCNEKCAELLTVQGVCQAECAAVALLSSSILASPRSISGTALIVRQNTLRQGVTMRPRPTRPPGMRNFERHWCCYDNGEGQCNASFPSNMGSDSTKIGIGWISFEILSRNLQILIILTVYFQRI